MECLVPTGHDDKVRGSVESSQDICEVKTTIWLV